MDLKCCEIKCLSRLEYAVDAVSVGVVMSASSAGIGVWSFSFVAVSSDKERVNQSFRVV
jgi:hypothetical protein